MFHFASFILLFVRVLGGVEGGEMFGRGGKCLRNSRKCSYFSLLIWA